MRLSFVSDIHGNIAGLADVARRVDQLVVLGDLLDYVDYYDPSGGIIGRIFGAERVRPFIALRLAGDFPGLRAYNRELWDSTPRAREFLPRARTLDLPQIGAGLFESTTDVAVGPIREFLAG